MANAKRKCTGCKARFLTETMRKLPVGYFHSVECSIDYAKRGIAKANKKKAAKVKRHEKEEKKAVRQKHKADKEKVKTRTAWLDHLQRLVNQYVVHVLDVGKPCNTCGAQSESIKYDAGHYRSRGSCPELRFELTNIHKQCSMQCNVIGSGMRAESREFIAGTYGANHLEWLDGKHVLLKDIFPHYLDIKAEIIRYRKLLRKYNLTPNG